MLFVFVSLRGVKAGTHWPTWTSYAFGETRTRSETNMLVCSAVSEAFGAALTLSAPTEYAKSRGRAVGRLSHWILWLVVCHSDWRRISKSAQCVGGAEYCAVMFCSPGDETRIVMSVQDKLICVRSVMPRCMFSLQLCLSEIVKFGSKVKWVACINFSFTDHNTSDSCLLCLAQAQNVHTTSRQHVEAVCFNATFLPNGSDKRQKRGRRVVA